jgi:hypothetical protein
MAEAKRLAFFNCLIRFAEAPEGAAETEQSPFWAALDLLCSLPSAG